MSFHRRTVNGRYSIMCPEHIARWDALADWERVRFASMEQHLHQGMTLFDVGAEQGPLSAIYATFVGGENMVLIEPVPAVWPNLRLTWEANSLDTPRATWCGLLGDRTVRPEGLDFDSGQRDGWPVPAWADELQTAMSYRYLHDDKHAATTPQSTLDDWVADTGVTPDAITIDVEGAELRVLRGADDVIAAYRPLIWVSVHPDLMERDYNPDRPDALYAYMKDRRYVRQHLGIDHEAHEFFKPAERLLSPGPRLAGAGG